MSVQILANGLSIGSVYALIAVGFCLVFSILKFTNFAHGAMITASAFIGFFFSINLKFGLAGTLLAAMAGGALVGLAGEFFAFRTITLKSSSTFYYFVSSLTWGILLEAVVTLAVGSNFNSFPRFLDVTTLKFSGIVLSIVDIIMFLCSCFALTVLLLFLNKTRLGRGIKATSYDLDTAYLMGVDVFRAIQVTFMLAGAMSGLAGVFLGMKYTLYPQLGNIVVKGFIASVIGGLGSISGAVIGAILLGLAENILLNFVGSGFTPPIIFVIMLLFLLIRPQGISGTHVQEKA